MWWHLIAHLSVFVQTFSNANYEETAKNLVSIVCAYMIHVMVACKMVASLGGKRLKMPYVGLLLIFMCAQCDAAQDAAIKVHHIDPASWARL